MFEMGMSRGVMAKCLVSAASVRPAAGACMEPHGADPVALASSDVDQEDSTLTGEELAELGREHVRAMRAAGALADEPVSAAPAGATHSLSIAVPAECGMLPVIWGTEE